MITLGFAIFGLTNANSSENIAKSSIRIGTTVTEDEQEPETRALIVTWDNKGHEHPVQMEFVIQTVLGEQYICAVNKDIERHAEIELGDEDDYDKEFPINTGLAACVISDIPMSAEIASVTGSRSSILNGVIATTQFNDWEIYASDWNSLRVSVN